MMSLAKAAGNSTTSSIPRLLPCDQSSSMAMPLVTLAWLSGTHDTSTSMCSTPACHAPIGRIARPTGEHLILAVVEEPDLRVVVRVGCGDCDPEPKRPCGDHPCETVECMPGERRCIGAPLGRTRRRPARLLLAASSGRPVPRRPVRQENSAGATVKSMGSVPFRLRYTASPGASRPIHPAVNQPKAPRTFVAARNPGMRTCAATGSSGSLNILG